MNAPTTPPDKVGDSTQRYAMLVLGTLLILVPLLIAIFFREAYGDAQRFLRIIASLGAGLIGAFIPGLFKLKGPGIEALGGMAVFALVLTYDPLWRVETAIEVVRDHQEDQDPRPSIAPPPSEPSAGAEQLQLHDCIARKTAEYEAPQQKHVEGGARAPGPGLSGGTKRAEEKICLSLGPDQEFISANTKQLSCHGGRCSVSAPEVDGKTVCVLAKAWSDSKSFGGGGSGQYRLIVDYRNLATDAVRQRIEAECRVQS